MTCPGDEEMEKRLIYPGDRGEGEVTYPGDGGDGEGIDIPW